VHPTGCAGGGEELSTRIIGGGVMSTSRTGHVLVATSGSASSQSAITFAARTAASRGLAVELVHVVTPTIAVGPTGAAPDIEGRRGRREVLAHCAALPLRVRS